MEFLNPLQIVNSQQFNNICQKIQKKFSVNCHPVVRVMVVSIILRSDDFTMEKKVTVDRKIENEEEIVEQLQQQFPLLKIQAIILENKKLEEQVSIISHTDILIGMHGAGIIHSLFFMKENTACIELFPKYWRFPHGLQIANQISVKRKVHYLRWISRNRNLEKGTDTNKNLSWFEKRERYGRNRQYSLTYVPPEIIVRKVRKAVHLIENKFNP